MNNNEKKQIKAIKNSVENRVEKQLLDTDKKSITSLFSKGSLTEEATSVLNEIVKIGYKLNRDDLIYETGNRKNDKKYDFQKFKTIRAFGRETYNDNFSLDYALEQQIRLKDDINILKKSAK